jgi:hypothetical protein
VRIEWAHTNIFFSQKYFAVQYNIGAQWNEAQPIVVRNSIAVQPKLGSILHAPKPARIVLDLISPKFGFPLTHSDAHPIIHIGG